MRYQLQIKRLQNDANVQLFDIQIVMYFTVVVYLLVWRLSHVYALWCIVCIRVLFIMISDDLIRHVI